MIYNKHHPGQQNLVMLIGSRVPDFTVPATHGHLDGLHFHSYISGYWACLFSHPADFTPVCTTELAAAQMLVEQFENVKFLAVSTDSLEEHERWLKDIEEFGNGRVITFPIIADTELVVSRLFGMLEASIDSNTTSKQTVRTVFIIRPDLSLAATIAYPMTVGRGFAELKRLLEALLTTFEHKEVATPVDWVPGEKVLVRPGQLMQETDEKTKLPYLTFRKI